MSGVYFDPLVGGDATTVTDDSHPTTGLGNDGHRLRFVPALAQIVAIANWVKNRALDVIGYRDAAAASAAASAASAASAVAAPGTTATSTTSLAIGTGAKALTIQTGKQIVIGTWLAIANTAAPANWMAGQVTAYDSGTGALTVNVLVTGGAGTFAAWTVSLSGPPGAADWIVLANKPTTVAGFGITDASTKARAYFMGGF